MKTVLAYVIVVILSQFCLLIGTLASLILSGIFCWLPEKFRLSLVSLIGGAVGSCSSVAFAFLIFRWVANFESLNLGGFLAAIVPLSIPLINDYSKFKQVQQAEQKVPESIREHTAPTTAAFKYSFIGESVGIAISIYFVFVY